MITEFEVFYNDIYLRSYDRIANSDRLNVWQLTPDGIRWVSGSGAHVLKFEEKGVACVSNSACVIAIVEVFLDVTRNYARFICQDSNTIIIAPIPAHLRELKCHPFDVFLSEAKTTILYSSTISAIDFRVEYNPELEIVEWSEFR